MGDVDYNPVFLSYVLLTSRSATLFVDSSRLDDESLRSLSANSISVLPYDSLMSSIGDLGCSGKKFWVDGSKTNWAIEDCIKTQGGSLLLKTSPIAYLKAVKNEIELEGVRAAHI